MFKSLLISKMDGRHSAQIAEIAESEPPCRDVEVNNRLFIYQLQRRTGYYGPRPIVRHFPMVPH